MNRKGFTLIELMATIALLAIIVVIAIPAVNSVISKNKKNNCQIFKDNIIRAGELYVSDNKYNLEWKKYSKGTYVQINTSVLYTEKYLNTKLKDPCNNSNDYVDRNIVFLNENGTIKIDPKSDLYLILPELEFSCCY